MATRNGKVVIVAAGSKHRECTGTSRAGQLWIGNYHSTCLRYAESITKRDNVFILSPFYGILPLDRMIEPVTISDNSKRPAFARLAIESGITVTTLQIQAIELNIRKVTPVVLGSGSCIRMCNKVWTNRCVNPFEGLGMGQQIQAMNKLLVPLTISDIIPVEANRLTFGKVIAR